MRVTQSSSVRRMGVVPALVSLALLVGACSSGSKPVATAASGARQLVGLFRLSPGQVKAGQITGSWFRMLQPGGNPDKGPYMVNADSPADGGQATLLSPGTQGGFRTGGYQSQPDPAFDSGGNSLAGAIIAPTAFFGVRFSISTNQVDLQTKTDVAPPTVVLQNGTLRADLASWAASWNNQNFNQGAPKPVSSTGAKAPGQEQTTRAWDWVSRRWLDAAPKPTVTGTGATGTFNASTGAFVLQWTSLIVGGPFNGFTGLWHLEGVFQPSASAPTGA